MNERASILKGLEQHVRESNAIEGLPNEGAYLSNSLLRNSDHVRSKRRECCLSVPAS